MKLTLDSNIFIYSDYDRNYEKLLWNFLQNKDSFITYFINDEVRSTILKINVFYHQLLMKLETEDASSILNQNFVNKFGKEFGNIVSSIKTLSESANLRNIIEEKKQHHLTVFFYLDRLVVYPKTKERTVETLNDTHIKSKRGLLRSIKEKDLRHLLLAYAYSYFEVQEEIDFVTEDNSDILSNKLLIERELNLLKVYSVQGWLNSST